MAFSDNLKKLPGISHLAAIELRDGEGNLAGMIENKSGSQMHVLTRASTRTLIVCLRLLKTVQKRCG